MDQSVAEIWPFTHVRNLFNFASIQYFENKLMELDNNLHMY